MVAPKENLLSLGHQINMEQRPFKTQRVETQKQKTLHLLQHCQEMQEGVIRAQEHNRQLLQQFKEAQGTLREMLTLTAAMKTTRMEYEKQMVGIPQWRQQLQENTWKKRNLNNKTERTSFSLGQPLPAQLSYDGSFHSPHVQSSWMVPPRNPHHPQDSTRAPPHLPSNPLQLYHQASGLSLHQSLPWQNVPDQPWFWTAAAAGITSGPEARFCMTEPTAESGQHSQMSSAPSSYKKSAGSRNSPSGQELDTQPDGSDSTTESSQVSKKKKGKSKHTSSEGERHSSPDFQAVSAVITGVEAARSSGSAASSESRSTMKSAGADGGPLKVENGVKERNKKNEDSQPSSEECEQTGREESGSQRESSGSVDIKMNNEYLSRSEGKNEDVKHDEELQEEDPEQSDEEVESDENMEDAEKQERKEDISNWNNTTDEENAEEMEEQESEEEESDGAKDKDNRKLDSMRRTRSSEEDVDAESEDLSKEDEASDENNKSRDSSYDEEEDEMEEKDKKGDEAAEGEDESDSDDCIISLQKSKRLHIIPEEAREDEDGEAKPGNSEEDSDEFSDDIKDPKTQAKKMKHEQKPKGFCNRMEIFQVETGEGSSHWNQASDSDEFDHFFD